MTDTKTLLTEPVTLAGGPILSLTKDSARDLLWVSTPSSSLSAWAPPSDPPSHPVHAIDLQAHPDPDPTDPPRMQSPRATPLRALSLPRDRLPTARKEEPAVTLKGTPPLVRCAAFEDRRHVLTQDAAGCIALWDLVQGKPVKQYSQDKVWLCREIPQAGAFGLPLLSTVGLSPTLLTLGLSQRTMSRWLGCVHRQAR